MNKGTWYAIGAFGSWGLFPLYWKLLQMVPPLQVIGHRIVWSFITLLIVIMLMRQLGVFKNAVLSLRVLGIYTIAALLIGINWLIFIWAVNTGHIVETSLGYFINPLISVLFGVIFFRERLRKKQWIPVGLAASGVIFLTIAFGSLPWIALSLAFSFAAYGVIKKIAPLNSLYGLTLETSILFIPALLYLVYCNYTQTGSFLHTNLLSTMLLMGAGFVTTIPLLLFASAAKRIPLTIIGILQYIAPTLQFLIGVIIFHESFSLKQFIGYSAVWIALVLFALESIHAYKARTSVTP